MSTALAIQNVPFYGDTIPASIDEEKNIWSVVSIICNNLGLTGSQKDRQVKNIQDDIVLQHGAKKMNLKFEGQVREALCIKNDYLPLWLAKISITPAMKNTQPEVVEKLVNYQLQVKDVLSDYFFGKPKPLNTPLNREELAAYMLYTEQHVDAIEKMNRSYMESMNKVLEKQAELMKNFCNQTYLMIEKNLKATPALSLPELDIETEIWKQKTFERLNRVAKLLNLKDGNEVLKRLYATMKDKEYIDVHQLHRKFNGNINIIDIIAKNSYLKESFDKYLNELYMSPLPTTKRTDEKFSQLVRHAPSEVSAIVQPLCKNNNGKPYALRRVYAQIDKVTDGALTKKAKAFMKKHKVSYVSKAYIIGHDEELMKLMGEIVSQMQNEVIS